MSTMINIKKSILFFLCIILSLRMVYAQSIGIKSNVLQDMTTTLNLGLEFSISRKASIDIPINYNPWNFNDGKRFKSLGVQPELRYWLCQKFNGHFVGIHSHYSLFNIGNLPFKLAGNNLRESRYEGYLYGAGLSYGYQWALNKRWGIELTAGLGYARVEYKKYPCGNCGSVLKKSHKNYYGPTKAGLSLIYLIK